MGDLQQDFAKLKQKIAQPSFQQNHGLSNEVGYYIFDYDAKDELIVRENVANIAVSSTVATIGADVKVFDLFDIMMGIVDRFGYREGFENIEREDGMAEVVTQMNNILDMDSERNLVVEYVRQAVENDKSTIIFLTGVGKIFPLLRSHKILNTMNQVIDKFPVVMFYPGYYDGVRLKMFGQLEDDNYYRAFGLRMEWNNSEN
ncbi:DUF1788 domain-containing protein [Lacticaseibacillus jixianensis]|uniref:DUF1788 domain-containing protein n=1 Tax=Lacticaseibacillus jixianensis TaxID=2486012 RepID=A0ABW4B9N9_9LACO|nr:DUF1788 domain-containing protein [Lacticaseibacillus jixianensis]